MNSYVLKWLSHLLKMMKTVLLQLLSFKSSHMSFLVNVGPKFVFEMFIYVSMRFLKKKKVSMLNRKHRNYIVLLVA